MRLNCAEIRLLYFGLWFEIWGWEPRLVFNEEGREADFRVFRSVPELWDFLVQPGTEHRHMSDGGKKTYELLLIFQVCLA